MHSLASLVRMWIHCDRLEGERREFFFFVGQGVPARPGALLLLCKHFLREQTLLRTLGSSPTCLRVSPMSSSVLSMGSFSRQSRTMSRLMRGSDARSMSSSSSSSSESTAVSGKPLRSMSPGSFSVAYEQKTDDERSRSQSSARWGGRNQDAHRRTAGIIRRYKHRPRHIFNQERNKEASVKI